MSDDYVERAVNMSDAEWAEEIKKFPPWLQAQCEQNQAEEAEMRAAAARGWEAIAASVAMTNAVFDEMVGGFADDEGDQ